METPATGGWSKVICHCKRFNMRWIGTHNVPLWKCLLWPLRYPDSIKCCKLIKNSLLETHVEQRMSNYGGQAVRVPGGVQVGGVQLIEDHDYVNFFNNFNWQCFSKQKPMHRLVTDDSVIKIYLHQLQFIIASEGKTIFFS